MCLAKKKKRTERRWIWQTVSSFYDHSKRENSILLNFTLLLEIEDVIFRNNL